MLPAAEQRRILNPPPPPPADPTRRQETVVGSMKYRWYPGRGDWVSVGPTSRFMRTLPERSQEILRGGVGSAPSAPIASGLPWSEIQRYVPYTDQFGRRLPENLLPSSLTASTLAAPPAPEEPSPTDIAAGAPSVDISAALALLPLAETEQEKAALESILADLQARAEAGMEALGTAWGEVQRRNQAAADKARSMVAQVGARAGAMWVQMAQAALEKAGVIAQQFGQQAGRQAINISPTAGAQNFAALMGALAPAYQAVAEFGQERLAGDLGFLSGLAGMQGAAYQGELERTLAIQSAQAAADHNKRVQERIAANQRTAAEMISQAERTRATLAASAAPKAAETLSPLEQSVERAALTRALAESLAGSPTAAADLAQSAGISPAQAQGIIADVLATR